MRTRLRCTPNESAIRRKRNRSFRNGFKSLVDCTRNKEGVGSRGYILRRGKEDRRGSHAASLASRTIRLVHDGNGMPQTSLDHGHRRASKVHRWERRVLLHLARGCDVRSTATASILSASPRHSPIDSSLISLIPIQSLLALSPPYNFVSSFHQQMVRKLWSFLYSSPSLSPSFFLLSSILPHGP